MKRISILAAAALIAAACAGPAQEFTCADGSRVRITAVTDNIIRVESVPEGAEFRANAGEASDVPSLMVVPQSNKPVKPIKSVDGDVVTLATAALRVSVNTATGCVSFADTAGRVYTSEHSRTFSPAPAPADAPDAVSAFTVRQQFESAPDEGFYGLGQHQADEWDYKGRNEELYQYNTKISVPFVVSSRRYGILWDSYSFCRWGDPRDYAPLGEVFRLYDKKGEEGALTGTYTPSKKSGAATLVRREPAINQEYLRTPECDRVVNSPEGFPFKGSKVVFEGSIEPLSSGLHHFYIYYAGYTKIFVDGRQVTPEIWRTAWNPNGRKFEVELQAGVRVPLRIEWEPDGDVSYCALKALSPVDPEEQGRMSWWGEMQNEIDYYFVAGEDIDGVIKGYRTLTGKAPMVPKWAMGYWQSRERYTSQDQILSTMLEFRERGIPIDNIVQDWQYWEPDQWGSHEFEASRFPDPKAMVDSIHNMGGRYMISVWPKFYTGTEHFREMDANGWMYQTPVRDSVEDWLGYQQSFYDAYAPGARKLFWQQMQDHLAPIGVDAWWMDASEPNIHDCTDMAYRKAMCGPTALGSSTQFFNAYALMNAQAIYEGQRGYNNERVFLLTRNGFAGLQRYGAASWSGDIGTRWEDMKAQISAGLNYSISGIPFWGQDVGGFSVEDRYADAQRRFDADGTVTPDLEEWRELQVRWHEWGVFCPLYRSHGQWPAREPWNIAPEGTDTYKAIVETDVMRYGMMPYIYSTAARVHYDDYTMMRPLVMDFTDDPVACGISDEFMFGETLLVCPVYEYGARERQVYLPAGSDWYDFYTDQKYPGGTWITAEAPLEKIPVYCRSGHMMIFTMPSVTTAVPGSNWLNIYIYGQENDCDFRLYEDDGHSYAYEDGELSWIPIHWDSKEKLITLGTREGAYKGDHHRYQVNAVAVGYGQRSYEYTDDKPGTTQIPHLYHK